MDNRVTDRRTCHSSAWLWTGDRKVIVLPSIWLMLTHFKRINGSTYSFTFSGGRSCLDLSPSDTVSRSVTGTFRSVGPSGCPLPTHHTITESRPTKTPERSQGTLDSLDLRQSEGHTQGTTGGHSVLRPGRSTEGLSIVRYVWGTGVLDSSDCKENFFFLTK